MLTKVNEKIMGIEDLKNPDVSDEEKEQLVSFYSTWLCDLIGTQGALSKKYKSFSEFADLYCSVMEILRDCSGVWMVYGRNGQRFMFSQIPPCEE